MSFAVISSVVSTLVSWFTSLKGLSQSVKEQKDYDSKLNDFYAGIFHVRTQQNYTSAVEKVTHTNFGGIERYVQQSYSEKFNLYFFAENMAYIGLKDFGYPHPERPSFDNSDDVTTPRPGNRSGVNERPNYGDANNSSRPPYSPTPVDERIHYFNLGRLSSLVYQFLPIIRDEIRRGTFGNDWFFASENQVMLLWTPTGWQLSPTTGYDKYGNFYYVDESGNASMLLAFDQPVPEPYDCEPTGSRYATFSGTSVRNWYESLQVIEQEKKVAEIQAREAEVEKALLTEREAEQKQYQANRSLYLRNGLITVGVLTGVYFVYKFIKKRKKL